jgi:hypothetical protein
MEHLELLRLEHTHTHKEHCDAPWTWTHIDSKKENRLPKGNINIRKGVNTKKDKMTKKENSKQT